MSERTTQGGPFQWKKENREFKNSQEMENKLKNNSCGVIQNYLIIY